MKCSKQQPARISTAALANEKKTNARLRGQVSRLNLRVRDLKAELDEVNETLERQEERIERLKGQCKRAQERSKALQARSALGQGTRLSAADIEYREELAERQRRAALSDVYRKSLAVGGD